MNDGQRQRFFDILAVTSGATSSSIEMGTGGIVDDIYQHSPPATSRPTLTPLITTYDDPIEVTELTPTTELLGRSLVQAIVDYHDAAIQTDPFLHSLTIPQQALTAEQ